MSKTAQEMLDLYIDAEAKVLAGQTVKFNGRELTRVNLTEIRNGRVEWERKVNAQRRGRRGGFSLASM